ncbi:hypothetical protein L249_0236, partial [Ophiocordyceps polyrhachis-furcata BCC 54312]
CYAAIRPQLATNLRIPIERISPRRIRAYTLLFHSLRIPPLARRLLGLGLTSRLPFHPSSGDLLRPAYNGFRLYRLSYPQPSHDDLP